MKAGKTLLFLGSVKEYVDKRERNEEKKFEGIRKEMYFTCFFPLLSWNDLLRFRRVSKTAKQLTDEYIKTRGVDLVPEIVIYEAGHNSEKTMSRFLQLGFPIKRLHLMNISGNSMFEKDRPSFTKFVEIHGPNVTHLRVHRSDTFLHGGIHITFYEGLCNLESFSVDKLGRTPGELPPTEGIFQFPSNFKQIKKLCIGEIPGTPSLEEIYGARDLFKFCENLEHAREVFGSFIDVEYLGFHHDVLGANFLIIKDFMVKRSIDNPEAIQKLNLKQYDFGGFSEDPLSNLEYVAWLHAPKFLELAKVCATNSVKLWNVNAAWLQHRNLRKIGRIPTSDVLQLVMSMVNMHGMVAPLQMPNLERLTILSTSECCLMPGSWTVKRRQWPSLKVIDVTVNSVMMHGVIISHSLETDTSLCLDPEPTASLIKFLFVGISRPNVAEVKIQFTEDVQMDDDTVNAVCHLGTCCPNLKKFTLTNWPGPSVTLTYILDQLLELEELTLDRCQGIGDLAFISSDIGDGILTSLTKLKSLSLHNLDMMPKITDALFKDVLCHMKLTHLFLSSDKPLATITPDGIRALKEGQFAKTIERFPFRGWSLSKLNKDGFKRLSKEFRSHQML